MDSLKNLLHGKLPEEPVEMKLIKQFVTERYGVTPSVALRGKQIIIGVRGAALAGALRPQLPALQQLCNTTQRLVLRIE